MYNHIFVNAKFKNICITSLCLSVNRTIIIMLFVSICHTSYALFYFVLQIIELILV